MKTLTWLLGVSLLLSLLLAVPHSASGQVGPAEITNPQLRGLEAAYLPQLVSMREAIAKLQFPFELFLSRYVGLDPKQQIGADARGLEFVLFHDRTVLKMSGNYNAAFDSALLTQNQRAGRVFEEVMVPVLRLMPGYFTTLASFDRFGFEVSYHVRTHSHSYVYEGKEILTVVMDKADALAFARAQTESEQQNILNASEIYANGQEFGLALHEAAALGADELNAARQAHDPHAKLPAAQSQIAAAAVSASPIAAVNVEARAGFGKTPVPGNGADRVGAAPHDAAVEALQRKLQPQLDALGTEGVSRYHCVAYAPPSLVVFRNRIHLQMTLRNPNSFDRTSTSIYKRAAQSFDLFLAPALKPLLDSAPATEEIAGFDITVLSRFGSSEKDSAEAIEFVIPLMPLRKFTGAEITNQDLINQSIVLVNGVRIALDLQHVE